MTIRPRLIDILGCVCGVLLSVFAADREACRAADAAPPAPLIRILTSHPQPMMANLGDDYRAVRLSSDRNAVEAIVAALAEHHDDVEFREAPLRDVLAMVAEKAGIRIVSDRRAFEDAGIDIDTLAVTASLEGVSIGAGLRGILAELDLTTLFRNERLVVTTVDAAAENLARYFYPALAGTDLDELIVLIEGGVARETWNTVGGYGSIAMVPSQMGTGLVIDQTEDVHEQIATLLGGLDAVLWKADHVDDGVEPRFVRTYRVPDPLTREAIVDQLLTVCNEALPHGADPKAVVTVIGEAVVVQSKSRSFHVMAAQLVAAIGGVETILIDENEADAEKEGETGGDAEAAHDVSIFRKAGMQPPGAGFRVYD